MVLVSYILITINTPPPPFLEGIIISYYINVIIFNFKYDEKIFILIPNIYELKESH